jgi:glutamine amidotransferase-like uncharacterized protein
MSRYPFKRRYFWLAFAIIGIVVASGILVFSFHARPLAGVRVSIFYDNGVQIQSKIAAEHMFEWMGAEVTTINKTNIDNGILNSTDLLVMPGGIWADERCTIDGEYEMNLIREYVLNGGAYFGIDGGTTYATNFQTGIFNGILSPDVFGTGFYLTNVEVNKDSQDPDLSGEPDSYSVYYKNSGYFEAENMTGIIPICSYENSSYCCMIAFESGEGRVFLTSPHPEYEEGNLNDGTDYFDRLNDPDSEWPFMLKIALWLLQIS